MPAEGGEESRPGGRDRHWGGESHRDTKPPCARGRAEKIGPMEGRCVEGRIVHGGGLCWAGMRRQNRRLPFRQKGHSGAFRSGGIDGGWQDGSASGSGGRWP